MLIFIKDLSTDWMIIILSIVISSFCVYCLPLTIFVVGNRQHALSILGHEATHKLVSKNKFINEGLGNFFCLSPNLIPWRAYRKFHAKHHKFLGTDEDPELPLKEAVGVTIENANKLNIISNFIKDIAFGGFTLKARLKPERKDLIDWLLVHSVIIGLGFINWMIPFVWYSSLISSAVAASRLRVWYEHVGTDSTHKIKATWWQRVLFLPHAAEYHSEHHEKPSVPYYLLHTIASEERIEIKNIH